MMSELTQKELLIKILLTIERELAEKQIEKNPFTEEYASCPHTAREPLFKSILALDCLYHPRNKYE